MKMTEKIMRMAGVLLVAVAIFTARPAWGQVKSRSERNQEAKEYFRNDDMGNFLPLANQLAEEGDADILYYLALAYKYGKGDLKIDRDRALYYFIRCAEADPTPYHQWIVGDYLIHRRSMGINTQANLAEGMRWLEKASKGGWDDAMFLLGKLYYLGDTMDGLPRDTKKGTKLIKQAAEKGNRNAKAFISEHGL